jgi:hypothetical protein
MSKFGDYSRSYWLIYLITEYIQQVFLKLQGDKCTNDTRFTCMAKRHETM